MYINFSVLCKHGLQPSDITLLIAVKQVETDYLVENLSVEDYKRFETLSLIKHIKPKRKDEDSFTSIRLDSKGKKLLEELEEAVQDEDSLKIFEWVKSVYLKEGKELGNTKKCKYYIAQFSAESGIVRNSLAYLIQSFLSDDKEFEYSQRLEYLFFKGATLFSIKFDLHQSRLYQYYQKHQNKFDTKFKEFD